MSLQYVYDTPGLTTSVIISINDWDKIRKKYPEVESIEGELPQWQKDVIHERMLFQKKYPNEVTSLDDFISELNKQDEDL